jgi:hypothetical protein
MKASQIIYDGVVYECRATVGEFPPTLGRKIDLRFFRDTINMACLGVICAIDSPDYELYASLSDEDLEAMALDRFLNGQLGMDLGSVMQSTRDLQAAAGVSHPVLLVRAMTPSSTTW